MTGEGHRQDGTGDDQHSRALEEALAAVRPPFDEDAAVAIALGEARGGRKPGPASLPFARLVLRGRDQWRRSGRTLRWGVPTLVGAGLAVTIWLGTGPDPAPLPAVVRVATDAGAGEPAAAAGPTEARTVAELDGEPVFSIDAPAAGQVAVFQTSNPKIRVVWFYEEGESED